MLFFYFLGNFQIVMMLYFLPTGGYGGGFWAKKGMWGRISCEFGYILPGAGDMAGDDVISGIARLRHISVASGKVQ